VFEAHLADHSSGPGLQEWLLPGFGVHDGNKILFCSDELATIIGAPSAREVVGRELLSLLAPESQDASIGAIASRAPGYYRATGLRSSGLKIPIEIYSCPIRFCGKAARLFTVRDLSPLAVVVDDDPPVANMTASLVRRLGYQTITFTSPSALLSDYPANVISVLISDVMMPDIDGIAMVQRIRQADPGLPVVFVSGFSETAVKEDALTIALAKPFGVQAIRDILARFPERARANLK
jgi:CheY-like chemotaxis protein